jgi:amidohydrolase
MDINSITQKYKQYVINLRREFHRIPEPSFKEFKTSERIKAELNNLDIPFITTGATGIVAEIKGKGKGKTVALRTDMDALQITECTNINFKSQNEGYMHACGHDGHIASLLCAAKVLMELQNEFNGTVKLIFQPAEENGLGAKTIIDAGFLRDVDGIFGIHFLPTLDFGKISVEAGPRMASADSFKITVKGKACHGATPQEGVDSIVAASAIVMNLQSIVSREINLLEPAVVSVGKFNSGTSYNIIAGEAQLEGTVRCFSCDTQKKIADKIERIVSNTAKTYNAEGIVEYNYLVPPVINNFETSKIAKNAAVKIFSYDNVVDVNKLFIAEDFSKYLNIVPGTFAFVGTRNFKKETIYPLHNDKFNIDEDSLPLAAAMHVQFAVDFLNQ